MPADRFRDECSRTLLGGQHTANLQIAVSSRDGVQIDRKIYGRLSHGGELSTGDQPA